MTKLDLLAGLKAATFVGSAGWVGTPTNLNAPEANGAQRWRVDYMEVVGTACAFHSTQFYVLNEGQSNEVAYWFQKTPVQTVGV